MRTVYPVGRAGRGAVFAQCTAFALPGAGDPDPGGHACLVPALTHRFRDRSGRFFLRGLPLLLRHVPAGKASLPVPGHPVRGADLLQLQPGADGHAGNVCRADLLGSALSSAPLENNTGCFWGGAVVHPALRTLFDRAPRGEFQTSANSKLLLDAGLHAAAKNWAFTSNSMGRCSTLITGLARNRSIWCAT